MVPPHSGMSLGLKTERQTSDTCCNVDGPEDTVLSEMSQAQGDKSWVTHSHEVPRGVRDTGTGSSWWCQGWGRGRSECFMGTECQPGTMEKF